MKEPEKKESVFEEEKERPAFSIIIPTWEDPEGLGRTLVNCVLQGNAQAVRREVIVVGDGYEEHAENSVKAANEFAKQEGQPIVFRYLHVRTHTGSGNIPRAAGLQKAKHEWVMFIDAGTSVNHNAFDTIATAAEKHPEAQIISWDMVQLMDPVPTTTTVYAVHKMDRSTGLPYVLPGCATAVRREVAQKVGWPDVPASDWAFFSLVWEKLFGKPEEENTQKALDEVVLIPWVLTVAYGARTARKHRPPLTRQQYNSFGYDKGWKAAKAEIVETTDGNDSTN